MLSFDRLATALELISLTTLTVAAWIWEVQVTGSMPLLDVARAMWGLSVLRRVYNNYLEAVFCAYPAYRTQSVQEHRLKSGKDLVGRDLQQLEDIVIQDRLTVISQFCLDLSVYFLLPGFYPAFNPTTPALFTRVLTLIGNHYIMSYGMYWSHRALHKNTWLWRNIHSIHHWAKHPLSRTTYQDHWADNFGNAIVGHVFAQILLPLDYTTFWVSRVFRVCESLEKHSGVSGGWNMAHTVQQMLPYAQMPHHHDWHHEGHKGCNYTFTAIGGLWDCVFGTRRCGRAPEAVRTTQDVKMAAETQQGTRGESYFDGEYACFLPLIGLAGAVAFKMWYFT